MEKKYISRKEAAEVFGVHPQTIANWLEKGILLGHVAQGSTFIDIQSIEQLKASFGDIVEAEAKIQQYKVEIKEQAAEYRKQLAACNEAQKQLSDDTWIYGSVFRNARMLAHLFVNAFTALSTNSNERAQYIVVRFLMGYRISEIAAEFHLCPERIRQIIEKSINRLKYANKVGVMNNDYYRTRKINDMLMEENMQLKAQYIQLKEQLEKRLYSANDPDNILNTNIEGLHLSPRTYHVLDINEIETLGDIAYSKRNKFEKLRGIGAKSMKELDDLLAAKGLHWKMTPEEYCL